MELETMGWISLIPAIIAIVLSFATKNTIVALLVACFVGTLVSGQGLLGLPTIIKEACGADRADEGRNPCTAVRTEAGSSL